MEFDEGGDIELHFKGDSHWSGQDVRPGLRPAGAGGPRTETESVTPGNGLRLTAGAWKAARTRVSGLEGIAGLIGASIASIAWDSTLLGYKN